MNKSPGTDAKEMLLAKMLQNANARGLGWCRFKFYADSDNCSAATVDHAVACCALGAALLEPDSVKDQHQVFRMTAGNDSSLEGWEYQDSTNPDDYEDVGYAFRQAMTVGE